MVAFVPTAHGDLPDDTKKLDVKFMKEMIAQSVARGGPSFQGVYAVTPAGRLLASVATPNDDKAARDVVRMMGEALAAWEKVPPAERVSPQFLSSEFDPLPEWAPQRKYPADGLVLGGLSRFLPHPRIPQIWSGFSNFDYAWFRRDEMLGFVPTERQAGAKAEVPRELVERLARFHLWGPFAKDEVRRAEMTSTVTAVAGGVLVLKLEGATVAGYGGDRVAESAVETRLLGRARFDTSAGRFVEFELLGLGERRGCPPYWNLGAEAGGPWPVAFYFNLAPDNPTTRKSTPYYIWGYGDPARPHY